MSASDAAPLPRLGEVFFDVRGNSRTMRLSWYAETGVAVFSIWQGGMCTGTFRLPIDDLPRMVEILQRGPHGRRNRRAAAAADPYGGTADPYGSTADPYGERTMTGHARYGGARDYPAGVHDEPDEFGAEYHHGMPDESEFTDTSGGMQHGDERFVPPYVPTADDGYEFHNPGGDAAPHIGLRHAAFRQGPRSVAAEAEREPRWNSSGYSHGAPYR